MPPLELEPDPLLCPHVIVVLDVVVPELIEILIVGTGPVIPPFRLPDGDTVTVDSVAPVTTVPGGQTGPGFTAGRAAALELGELPMPP